MEAGLEAIHYEKRGDDQALSAATIADYRHRRISSLRDLYSDLEPLIEASERPEPQYKSE